MHATGSNQWILHSDQEIVATVSPFIVDTHAAWDLDNWLSKNQSEISDQLTEQGSVLLRGLQIDSAERLNELVSLFPLQNYRFDKSISYVRQSHRTDRVFVASDALAAAEVPLHHELAQTPFSPDWLFLSCGLIPDAGGATSICRSDLVYQDLLANHPAFLHQCETQGIYYRQKFAMVVNEKNSQEQSWPELLEITEIHSSSSFGSISESDIQALKTRAEKILHEKGYHWQWHNTSLEIISPVLPAVRLAKNHQKVFFNHILAAYTSWNDDLNSGPESVFFGDGQAIAAHDIKLLASICHQYTKDIRWQVGDLAILDNYMVMNGRRSFSGKRQIFASLAVDW